MARRSFETALKSNEDNKNTATDNESTSEIRNNVRFDTSAEVTANNDSSIPLTLSASDLRDSSAFKADHSAGPGQTTPPSSDGSTTDNMKSLAQRRKSIPVTLQTTDQAGQYTINTDDPELHKLLKDGVDQSTSGERKPLFRDVVLKKQFTAFDRSNTGELPSFHGFFTLFWIGVFLMIVRVAAKNWRQYGSVLGKNEIMKLMLSKDVVLLGVVDCLMMLSGLICVGIQVLIYRGWISWNRTGWILQSVWQVVFLIGFIGFSRVRDWPWTHAVFITLHTLAFLMKQHSYAFYNGYLSEVYKRRARLQSRLDLLSEPNNMTPASPLLTTTATSYFDISDLPSSSTIRQRRRPSAHPSDSNETLATVVSTIQSNKTLSYDQLTSLRTLISSEITSLTAELTGSCKLTSNHYPTNLTATDYLLYIPLPTVIYELEYPRDASIRWSYVAEKLLALFGTLFVMNIVSTAYIYPIVQSTLLLHTSGASLSTRLAEFPWAFLDLLFPLMMEYLLSWYCIWEVLLNLLAELTRYSDRLFYSAWWNSVSWDSFARDWNRPVHNFLLRHAYHTSISTYSLSRLNATVLTFLISACVHELVMSVIFGKVRGYLLMLQMCQVPLVLVSRTRWMRGRDVLGNAIFWVGIFCGPSFLCTLYLFL